MTQGDRVADLLDRLLGNIESVLIAALTTVALALGTMQVLLRYVFNTGFEWTEAFFVLATVTAMLVAGSRAVRNNAHVRVDIIHMVVPVSTARVLDGIAYLFSFLLCAFFAYCGWLFVEFSAAMDTASPETGLMDWLVYSIMPTVMMLFCLRYLLKIRMVVLGRIDPHVDEIGTSL
jgi:C4-dicarboxylate transporter DctQ subunit